jgi:exodeoxyribonuclease VII large subunit
MFAAPTWSVSELTHYLRELLESDNALQDVWVVGEVSNLSRPVSGHLYFTLKDGAAALRCVMWRALVLNQTFTPQDGDAIEIHGRLGIYETAGNYQLYADRIRPAGIGVLYQEFLRLKERLEAEGLFDPARKRLLPRWPQTIGIVTSPTGAALRDMLDTIRRRYPLARVILAPTPVQGEEAPAGIQLALESLNRIARPDVILVARGGGSIEDLWAFNDERVARAIAASAAPVIAGVGHETDFTIADFAADLRAPTPTAAAELSTPDRADLRLALSEQERALGRSFARSLIILQRGLDYTRSRLLSRTPLTRILRDRQQVDELFRRGAAALGHRVKIERARLTGLDLRLAALNPVAVLDRGYAIVRHEDGRLVRSVNQVKAMDGLEVRVSDGQFAVRVERDGKTPIPADIPGIKDKG